MDEWPIDQQRRGTSDHFYAVTIEYHTRPRLAVGKCWVSRTGSRSATIRRLVGERCARSVRGRGQAVNKRRAGGWSGLRKADRIAILMVGAGIIVINAILIALLF